MREAGHDVKIIIPPDCPYEERLEKLGIPLLRCYPKKKICIDSIRGIRQELSSQAYDILYATNSKSIPNAAFAAIGSTVKMVAYRGTTGGLYRHDPTAYLTILHPRVDGVICVSEAVRQDVLKAVWKNRDQVVTIYKGHNPEWYTKQPADLSEFGIQPGDFVAICAVNVRRSKGIDIMLDACNKMADMDRLHLILAGKGMETEPYASQIAKSPMKNRIHVAGFRKDAPELIAASDVLVQPSRSGEGLPRAVMESLGYGTAVVITDTGGGKEVVEDGVSGFVVPVEDPGSIEARVRQLYNDRALLKAFSANGLQRLKQNFSSANTTDQMLQFFNTLRAKH